MSKKSQITKTEQNKQVSVQGTIFSGPIPDPETLRKYENLLKGAADRILTMAEEQSSHRRQLENQKLLIEKESIKDEHKERITGLLLAFVFSLSVILASLYAITNGYQITGSILAGGVISGVIVSFILGRKGIILKYLYQNQTKSKEKQSDK